MTEKENGEIQRPRILLVYRRMIPSIRLCGHCQLEALAAEGKVEYRAVTGLRLNREDLEWAQVALLGRLDSWYELNITRQLKQAGKYLIYMMDDDLLNVPMSVTSGKYYNQRSIRKNILNILENCDAVLSPSPLLLEKYALKKGKRAIQIEEPALVPEPYHKHDPQKPVKIGFAGSVDRMEDLNGILQEVLPKIKREYGSGVLFEFFGAKPSFAGETDAKCLPYMESYDMYREALNRAEWDIGLAPMPESPFHACKHYNKFVEYAASGIAGVYSEVPPYNRLTAFPDCGILCDNSSEAWEKAIRRLLADPEFREKCRKKAADYASTVLNEKYCGEQLIKQLEGITDHTGKPVCSGIHLVLLKMMNLPHRGKSFMIAHGFTGSVRRIVEKLKGKL